MYSELRTSGRPPSPLSEKEGGEKEEVGARGVRSEGARERFEIQCM